MKEVKLIEDIIASAQKNDIDIDECLAGYGNIDYIGLVFDAYRDARECGSDYLTIACHLRDNEIDPTLNAIRKFGFTEFAVTNKSTALMDMLGEFQKRGWKVKGLEEIPVNRLNWFSKGEKKFKTELAMIIRYEPEKNQGL